jgi:hypothetical protein
MNKIWKNLLLLASFYSVPDVVMASSALLKDLVGVENGLYDHRYERLSDGASEILEQRNAKQIQRDKESYKEHLNFYKQQLLESSAISDENLLCVVVPALKVYVEQQQNSQFNQKSRLPEKLKKIHKAIQKPTCFEKFCCPARKVIYPEQEKRQLISLITEHPVFTHQELSYKKEDK